MLQERKKFLDGLPEHLRYEPVEVIDIGGRFIGRGHPAFIIAEVGANHRRDINNALRAIELAAEAGADAVKFQHLTHDKIAADTPVSHEWHGKKNFKTFSDFYKTSEMPYEWTELLVAHAEKHNIMFLSTPFDKDAVDVLERVGVAAYKVASYEMADDIFLRYVARKGKPIILSTGMAYLEEVAHAVRVIQEEGNNQIVVLHCTSVYPPKNYADLNLNAIVTLHEALKIPVGYSDHSAPPEVAVPVVAVALGACIIEKHFTDNRMGGSHDDPSSMLPGEFKHMVKEIRSAEQALLQPGIKQPISKGNHELGHDEIVDRWARRSLYAASDIEAGATLTEDMIITLRPWGGIEPKDAGLVIGKKLLHNVKAREPITWEVFLNA